jgi:hypothetical protein
MPTGAAAEQRLAVALSSAWSSRLPLRAQFCLGEGGDDIMHEGVDPLHHIVPEVVGGEQ